MGVSTTGESGEAFPTRILTLEIYWRIPAVLVFRNSGPNPNPQTFQFLVGGTLDRNSLGDFWYVPGFPSIPEAADTPLI